MKHLGLSLLLPLLASCGDQTVLPKNCKTNKECGPTAYCGSAGICIFDATGPSIALLSPEAGHYFGTDRAAFSFQVDCEGAPPLETHYSLNGDRLIPVNLSGNRLELSVEIPLEDAALHSLRVVSVDSAGNSAELKVPFFVDRKAPKISFTQPDQILYGTQDIGTSAFVEGIVADGGPIARVEVSLDGGKEWTALASQTSFRLEVPIIDGTIGTTYSLSMRAVDMAGNTTSATSRQLFVDTVAPKIALNSPIPGDEFCSGESSLLVEGSIIERALRITEAALTGGQPKPLQVSEDGRFSALFQLPISDYHEQQITLVAIDEVGNKTELARPFVMDRLPPRISLNFPTPGEVFTLASPSATTITGSIDDARLASAQFLVDSKVIATLPSGPFNVAYKLPEDDFIIHSVEIVALDELGNSSELKRDFLVDRVPPKAFALVDKTRLVSPTSPIVKFSEPIQPESLASARMNGSPVALSSQDGLSYSISSAGSVAPYTVLSVVVGPDTRDRAGNPMGSSMAFSFLSQPMLPSQEVPVAKTISRDLALAVDRDGLPSLAYFDSSLRRISVAAFDGTSLTAQVESARQLPPDSTLQKLAHYSVESFAQDHLALASNPRLAWFESSASGPTLLIAHRSGAGVWRGLSTPGPDTMGMEVGHVDFLPSPIITAPSGQPAFGTSHSFIYSRSGMPAASSIHEYSAESGKWLSRAPIIACPGECQAGRGLLGVSGSIFHLETASNTGIKVETTSHPFLDSITQQIDFHEGSSKPVGSAYLLRVNASNPSDPQSRQVLHVACSSAPKEGTPWLMSGDLAPPGYGSSWSYVDSAKMAGGIGTIAVSLRAIRADGRRVAFHGTFTNTVCSSAPTEVIWGSPIMDADSIDAAPTPGGGVWVAYHRSTDQMIILRPPEAN